MQIRSLVVYINVNNLRKKKFLAIQQTMIDEKMLNQKRSLKIFQDVKT